MFAEVCTRLAGLQTSQRPLSCQNCHAYGRIKLTAGIQSNLYIPRLWAQEHSSGLTGELPSARLLRDEWGGCERGCTRARVHNYECVYWRVWWQLTSIQP